MKTIVLIACLCLAVTAKLYAPSNIADEILKQVDELESIVKGDILTAHNDLDSHLNDFKSNSLTVTQTGIVALQQTHQTVSSTVQSIKDAAFGAGVDPSPCIDVREAVLDRLPQKYQDDIGVCIKEYDDEATRVKDDARYIVDVMINQVHDLRQRVERCHGDLLCLSPLQTEVALAKIKYPQNINTEVQAYDSLLTTLKLSVQSCADNKVAQYTTEAYSILGDIQACVDRILPP